TLANVIASSEHKRRIGRLVRPLYLLVDVTGQGFSVEEDEIFFKRSCLSNCSSVGSKDHARAIEHQLIVSAHLVHERDRKLVVLGNIPDDIAAQLSLTDVEGRSRNIENDL